MLPSLSMLATIVSPQTTAPTPSGVPVKISVARLQLEEAGEVGDLLLHRPDHVGKVRPAGARRRRR